MAAETSTIVNPEGVVNRQQLRDHLASDEFRTVLLGHAQGLSLVNMGDMRSCFEEMMARHTAEFSTQGAAIMATVEQVSKVSTDIAKHSSDFDQKHSEREGRDEHPRWDAKAFGGPAQRAVH